MIKKYSCRLNFKLTRFSYPQRLLMGIADREFVAF